MVWIISELVIRLSIPFEDTDSDTRHTIKVMQLEFRAELVFSVKYCTALDHSCVINIHSYWWQYGEDQSQFKLWLVYIECAPSLSTLFI